MLRIAKLARLPRALTMNARQRFTRTWRKRTRKRPATVARTLATCLPLAIAVTVTRSFGWKPLPTTVNG